MVGVRPKTLGLTHEAARLIGRKASRSLLPAAALRAIAVGKITCASAQLLPYIYVQLMHATL